MKEAESKAWRRAYKGLDMLTKCSAKALFKGGNSFSDLNKGWA